jgi:hypothetical protein
MKKLLQRTTTTTTTTNKLKNVVGQAEKDFQSDDSTRKKPIYYDNISMMFLIKYNSNNVYVGGLDWTGLDWTGLDWTGLDWTGLDRFIYIF